MQYCKLVIQEVQTVCRKLLYFALTDDEHILKLLIFPHFKILKIFCEVFFYIYGISLQDQLATARQS